MLTTSVSRRFVLSAGSAAIIANAARGRTAQTSPFFARNHLPIGIQLYTMGDLAQKDPQGTLNALASIGYRTVELAGFLGLSPRALRSALDHAGLSCPSAHISPQSRGTQQSLSGDLGQLAEDAHTLGIEYIVAPTSLLPVHASQPQPGESGGAFFTRAGKSMTADDWRTTADFLNSVAKRLKPLGLKLGYHNHNFEFAPLPGGTGLDILLRETDPELVHFEMDVGWVAAAGIDPVQLLQAHAGRFRLMHIKDIKPETHPNTTLEMDPTEVGSGAIPWTRVLPEALKAGVHGFYVEQEPPFALPRLESVRKSFQYLSGL
jgi:sugar phosphate isomerase/epimerase